MGLLQAVTVAVGFEDVAAVREPIERGTGEAFAAEDFGPVFEQPSTLLLSNTAIQQVRRALRSASAHCSSWSSGAINAWMALMEENHV